MHVNEWTDSHGCDGKRARHAARSVSCKEYNDLTVRTGPPGGRQCAFGPGSLEPPEPGRVHN